MKKFNGYEEAKPITENMKLPSGGYVVKILDAKEETFDWGGVLAIRFDIAEGEFDGFYKKQYENQTQEDKKWKGVLRLYEPKDDGTDSDNFTKRRFKTAMMAIEESNQNFHWDWDERKLKGNLVGALFGNTEWEYNGKTGFYTECRGFIPIQKVRDGAFKIPADKLLKNRSTTQRQDEIPAGFQEVNDDDIPF